jgi:hypothetical protein
VIISATIGDSTATILVNRRKSTGNQDGETVPNNSEQILNNNPNEGTARLKMPKK